MSTLLYALGRAAYRRRRRVLAAWLLALVAAGGLAALFSAGTSNSFVIPGTPSQQALDQLAVRFPEVSGGQAQVVAVTPDGRTTGDAAVKAALQASAKRLGEVPGVAAATDPYAAGARGALSADGRAALITVQLDKPWDAATDADRAAIEAAAAPAREAGLRTEFGGQVFGAQPPALSPTEAAGVVVALLVLIITFGSLRAAGIPVLTALLGVAVTSSLVLAASGLVTISSTVPLLALMIGLAVGIDYALFVLSRHRDQLAEGIDPEESAARSLATAGSAVVFAGLTVIIALTGLAVARIPFLTTMGIAAAGAVAIAVLVALTLLPAIMGFAGARLTPRRRRRGRREPGRLARGWVRAITRHPLVTIALVAVPLAVAAVPALDLRLAISGNGTAPAATTQRQAYDLVDQHFGPGWNGPLLVTADIIRSTDPVGVVNRIADELRALPGVADIGVATPNRAADTGIVVVVPEQAADAPGTQDLVRRIRDLDGRFRAEYGVDTQVTGATAVQIDVSERLRNALLPFGLLVVGLSIVLLGAVFRSVIVPLKAAAGYLLSVGVAFGVVVAVFQWGWLAGLFGVERTGPLISFMPIIVMGVLFGLAMDYEVFLVSRMREEYVHGRDADAAVQAGFTAGARVVTAAGLIMVAVFAAFVPEGDPNIKPIALALAVGIAVDAFAVRMTLVPAVLALVGPSAWWLPRWLDRRVPRLDIEGEGLQEQLQAADWPLPGSSDVIDDEGLAVSGPDGVVFFGVDLAVERGVVLAVHGGPGSGKTALLLALAGRLPLAAGRLKVAGLLLPAHARAVRARAGLAETPGINDLEESLSVEQHVAERLAAQRLRPWVPRQDVRRVLDAVDDAVLAADGTVAVLGRRTLVADLTPLERRVLGLALGLIGSPALLVVDEADTLRSPAERAALWRALTWITEHRTDPAGRPVTVVASCHDPGEAVASVPPDRLRLLDIGAHRRVPEGVS